MALVKELRRLLPMAVDTSALAGQTEAFDAAVADLVEENPELAGYIERLEADSDEEEVDEEGSPGLADVPPEELVAEVERYLRDHPGGSRNKATSLGDHPGGYGSDGARSWPTKEAAAAWNPSSRRPAGESRTCSSASIPAAAPDPAQAGKELVAALDAFAAAGDDHQVEHQVLCASVLGLKADLGVMAVGPDLVRHEALARTLRAVSPLEPAYSFLSLTEVSEYMESEATSGPGSRPRGSRIPRTGWPRR